MAAMPAIRGPVAVRVARPRHLLKHVRGSLVCLALVIRWQGSSDSSPGACSYFKWLLRWNARDISSGDVHFLPTDVVLVVDADLRKIVQDFAADEQRFFQSFARAYLRMVSLGTSA